MSDYYNTTGLPATLTKASSQQMRDQFTLTDQGFDKVVTLTGNGDKVVFVNSGGTAQAAKTADEAQVLLNLEVGVDVYGSADVADFAGLTLGGVAVDLTDASWGAPETTSTILVPAAGVNVDASGGTVVKTLPVPLVVGSVFQIHRLDNVPANICRIAASSNTIRFKDVAIVGDLTLKPGETVKLVAKTTTRAEIV